MKNGGISLLTLILISVIAAGGYYILIYQPQKSPVPADLTIQQITPSANPSVMPSATVDETETIKSAVKSAIVAKRGVSANELTYTVSEIIGNYARGGASAQGGGAMWFAAKLNGTWTLVWDGNGVILCTDIAGYPDFPKTMIPECYNEQTKKTVTR
jgi:hypothetical protein